jgi:prepilin-type N-terminal cleavage/methylation domain-containing protein
MNANRDRGFSLIETMVAMGILSVGLLSLAGVFSLGLRHMGTSSPGLIAREKAREAVESVHTARDTRVITWAQIRNLGDGGVFQDGAQALRTPGTDGLVNTVDDGPVERLADPGHDRILGTGDDRLVPLDTFTRQIEILDVLDGNGVVNPLLRELRVVVSYRIGSFNRSYTLTTFISAIS